MVSRYQSSLFVDLQQRAHEFFELAKVLQRSPPRITFDL